MRILMPILCFAISLSGCPKDDSSSPKKETVSASYSADGIIQISLDVMESKKTAEVRLANVPKGSVLSCTVNKEYIDECEKDMTFPLPEKDGVHSFTAVARISNNVVAVGEAHFSTGEASNALGQSTVVSQSVTSKYASDLTLEIDPDHQIGGQAFSNGMAIDRTAETKIKFRFVEDPGCKAEIRCTSDRNEAKFSPLCEEENAKIYKAHTMPKGLQFLRVQASCGDKVGEPIAVHWYGVPKDYKYMALDSIHFADTDTYVFTLMNPKDCPGNLLKFECRNSPNDIFETCKGKQAEANVVEKPTASFQIRGVCNGTAYQEYSPSES